MTDAGFFRGTSADQDNRFADKQKKLLKEMNFSPILNTKLNMSKIEIDNLKPWIELKIKEILEKDDDILSDSIFEYLKDKEPDGKSLLPLITGFVDETKAAKFVEELWTKLIELQDDSNGISPKLISSSSPGNGDVEADKSATLGGNQPDGTEQKKPVVEGGGAAISGKRESRSRSRTPESRSNSKVRSGSRSGSPHQKKSDSKSRSKSPSKSGSKSPSRSGSGSRSASHSRSRSKSSTRSPRRTRSRSRSPLQRSSRTRRSRSRSHSRSRSRSGSYRRRSRSPRGRRGYGRFNYRGYGYERGGRRGGPVGPPRRRPSPPWSRRRYSPGSPSLRRRRTPSPMSPRRRSRSPYYRRRSRSRSPPPYSHMMGRRSPRPPPMYSGRPDMGSRVGIPPHRELHRPILTGRSPRMGGLIDHRGYGDAPIMPRHSPANMMMGRQHDLPPISHGPPGPSAAYSSPSPSSGRKKHKKDKKHRKHKKSKRHRSATPEKKKKHKKHKKTKKHKS